MTPKKVVKGQRYKSRKPVPRPKEKAHHEVWVQPKGRFKWKIEVDNNVLGTTRLKQDAESIGRFIAVLLGNDGPTEFYVATRDGTIEDRSTFPRSADPRRSEG